jgi:hypothetical protein
VRRKANKEHHGQPGKRDNINIAPAYTLDHHDNTNLHHLRAQKTQMARQNRTHYVMHAETNDGIDGKGKLAGHVGGYHKHKDNK